ncbi:hypothetical protein OQA88_1237 [Cercophora sp. LCS_1]
MGSSARARERQQPQKNGRSSFSGWKGLGAALTIFTAILTILLVSGLLVSIVRYGNSSDPLNSRSTIFRGHCPTASRYNLLIHLAINAIASGVLASSNFFMQVLVAPTRNEINKAHAKGRWLEVGVQSWRNVFHLPRSNLAIWFLFALSSVPLHLVFNGSIIQSKASTDFLLVVAAEPFIHGASFELPSIMEAPGAATKSRLLETLQNISASVSGEDAAHVWERIDLGECIRRYNDPDLILTSFRHAIMVINYANGTSADEGWDAASVLPTISRNHTLTNNHLWWAGPVSRTDSLVKDGRASTSNLIATLRLDSFIDYFNIDSGRMMMERESVSAAYLEMQAQFCMSERFEVPCRLDVENLLLLLVCVMCAFKCVLCAVVMGVVSRKGQDRLTTPGDAIESFIVEPDTFTVGMCTLSRNDPLFTSNLDRELPQSTTPRQWVTPSRWAGRAIPTSIWLLSYGLIGSSLILGAAMMGIAARDQSVIESQFGHAATNLAVEGGPRLQEASLLELTMIANIPQLLLSMCYLAYNGLYTRMFAEFEWAAFSAHRQPLRVTRKRGQQRSTHRLQLPYQWSIPLILVSLVLHWLYSNTIYVSVYEGHRWNWPYPASPSEGLQYSTVAIVISFAVTMLIAIMPFYIARTKLPGPMVLAGGNTMVISAACHVVRHPGGGGLVEPLETTSAQDGETSPEDAALVSVALGRLKWGAMAGVDRLGSNSQRVGHLAFGSQEQGVEEPVQGQWYAGTEGSERHLLFG